VNRSRTAKRIASENWRRHSGDSAKTPKVSTPIQATLTIWATEMSQHSPPQFYRYELAVLLMTFEMPQIIGAHCWGESLSVRALVWNARQVKLFQRYSSLFKVITHCLDLSACLQ
jgi:hypothetical protein